MPAGQAARAESLDNSGISVAHSHLHDLHLPSTQFTPSLYLLSVVSHFDIALITITIPAIIIQHATVIILAHASFLSGHSADPASTGKEYGRSTKGNLSAAVSASYLPSCAPPMRLHPFRLFTPPLMYSAPLTLTNMPLITDLILGIQGYSKLKKAQLVNAIQRASPSSASGSSSVQPALPTQAPTDARHASASVKPNAAVIDKQSLPSTNFAVGLGPSTLSNVAKDKSGAPVKTPSEERVNIDSSGNKRKRKRLDAPVAPTSQPAPRSPPDRHPLPAVPSNAPTRLSSPIQLLVSHQQSTLPDLVPNSRPLLAAVTQSLGLGISEQNRNGVSEQKQGTVPGDNSKMAQRHTPKLTKLKLSTQASRVSAIRTPRRFVPLAQTATRPRLSSSISAEASSIARQVNPSVSLSHGASSTDRESYIQRHFLDCLFHNLNQSRGKPTTSFLVKKATRPMAFTRLSRELYINADHEAFEVAVRWWVARLHTSLQLGSGQEWSVLAGGTGLLGPDMTLWPAVKECKKIVDGIYLVVTGNRATEGTAGNLGTVVTRATRNLGSRSRRGDHKNSEPQAVIDGRYLVLEATGDVIASSSPSLSTHLGIAGCNVRPDWYSYIINLMSSSPASTMPTTPFCGEAGACCGHRLSRLMSRVSTKDSISAPAGIRRAWMDHVRRSADVRPEEKAQMLQVAERAVLSSCVLNSGQKLTAVEMDAAWLGKASVLDQDLMAPGASLFAPSHQVLSVHLPPAPTIPALAVVHRGSGKSDWVLRDTGHVVGDEDVGISELWQGILGCDRHGAETNVDDFWRGWEGRVRGDEWE
ncbi:unnamed protein product [Cutaneotrichosporon oleaginosum]